MVVAAALLATCTLAFGLQESSARTSQQQAAELVRVMSERKLPAFVAADPGEDGRFVAAMHIPGSQLLVIRTRYAAPSLIRERILAGDFSGIYTDLHSAGERDGRLFIMDSGADGLTGGNEDHQRIDVSWRDARDQTMFNGEWKEQKLTETEYKKRFADQERAYADGLGVLIDALRSTPTQ